jgi:DNA-binding LytR/AlgR family response regulator
MKIKTLAIDDEPLALQLVSGFVQKTPFLELKGSFDNPVPALEYLKENDADLIFLDIHMPDITGTAFAEQLDKRVKIVFTTAHDRYAVEGFRLRAVDFLLKPFSYEDFLLSAQRAKYLIELEKHSNEVQTSDDSYIFLKSDYKIFRVNFRDILYIEGLKEYIRVFLLSDAKPILSINTLKNIETRLPSNSFMRVHRSYIVNLEHIRTIERQRIIFGKVAIPVTDQYKEKFQEYIGKRIL